VNWKGFSPFYYSLTRKGKMNTELVNNRSGKNTILMITAIASFLVPFMMSSASVILPSIGNEYKMNAITLSWVTTSYLLASASLLIPFGRIADITGRGKIFLLGCIVFMIGSIMAAMSVSELMLLASRVIQGTGGAAIMATSIAILTSAFPSEERGKALGIITGVTYVGLSTGPFLGGLLTEHTGWRSVFVFSASLNLIVTILAFWKLRKESSEVKGERLDYFGSIIFCLTLVAIMYGLSVITSTIGIYFVAAGIAGGAFFFWWETRVKYPLIHLNLFRQNRGFAFSNVAALINYSGVFAVSFLLSLYLQYAKGLSPEAAGIILVANPVVQAIFSPLSGKLSDRIEPRILATAGMIVTTVGISLLIFLSAQTSLVYIVASLIILGFGFALFSSPNTNAVMSSVNKQYYGFASATLATMRQVGMMVNMGITMVTFAIVIGRAQITPEYYPAFIKSTNIVFAIAAVLCFSAIFASLARGNIRINTGETK
jgi:EmrB/QacA subfamily drug resistance transporter